MARLSNLAVCGKKLAVCGKHLFLGVGTLACMKTPHPSHLTDRDTRDFAIVGVHRGRVVVEANEWDLSMGVYRVVTLYLNPENAIKLAEQLISCAAGANQDGATSH